MTPADDHLIDLDLPAVPESAPLARRAVVEALEGVPVDRDGVAGMVSEAVANSALHAYPEGTEVGRVRVSAAIDGNALDVVVSDDGVGTTPTSETVGARPRGAADGRPLRRRRGLRRRRDARDRALRALRPRRPARAHIPREPFGGRARRRLARLLRRSG